MKKLTKMDLFTLLVIVMVMINNIEHISFVHYSFAQHVFPQLPYDWLNKLHSAIVVVIIELSIIVFVIKGKKIWAGLFTFSIFILSIVYYDVIDGYELMTTQEKVSTILLSLIYTISIYIFSDMFSENINKDSLISELDRTISEKEQTISEKDQELKTIRNSKTDLERTKSKLGLDIMNREADMSDKKQELSEIENRMSELKLQRSEFEKEQSKVREELTCPYCKKYKATTINQLNAHKGSCDKKPNV